MPDSSHQALLRSTYVDGLADGIEMALNQLDPRATPSHPGGRYEGPVPDELRDWIVWARANLDRERAQRRGTAAS